MRLFNEKWYLDWMSSGLNNSKIKYIQNKIEFFLKKN